MSRTYRRRRYSSQWMRSPKGRINAIVNQARNASIPPDPWDDFFLRGENSAPDHVARHMIDRGKSPEYVIRKISKKFHIQKTIAIEIVLDILKTIERSKNNKWFTTSKRDRKKKWFIENALKDMSVEELKNTLSYFADIKKSKHYKSVFYNYIYTYWNGEKEEKTRIVPLNWAIECVTEMLKGKDNENTPTIG